MGVVKSITWLIFIFSISITIRLKKGGSVLVLPDYGNNSNTTEIGKYHYQLRGCKLKHGNEIFTVIAQVHSHQDRGLDATPSYYTGDSYGDLGFSMNHSKLPVFVIGHDGNIHGIRREWIRTGKRYEPTLYKIIHKIGTK